MAKKKGKSVEEHLPKKAPKRIGKKGVGPKDEPLDPVKDFETPVKQEPAAELQGSALPESEKKKPRQARLPTMEDRAIEELEDSAENYADVRDQRMELTREESRLKDELLGLMKKHKKTSYVHDGFDIKVIVESEKLRVRIKKED